MSKGLEALAKIKKHDIHKTLINKKFVMDKEWEENYQIIEKELKRLEELEKAFKALSKDDEKAKKLLSLEIEKNRALEIIKEKRVDVCYFMNCRTLEEYNDDVLASYAYDEVDAEQRMLTQQEYDLLREVLL